MQTSYNETGSECSMSYGALVQQSTTILRNEITLLEDRTGQKRKDILELKNICARQTENISKQQSELEHCKMKTHSEVMQNKSHLSKIHNLREKLTILDKNMGKWSQTINPMIGYKNELEEIVKQLKLKLQTKENSSEHLEKEYNNYIETANKAFLELQERKEQEKVELCQLKSHLSCQYEQQKQQENEFEQELREQLSACREEKIKIDIIQPQRAELKKTFETLKAEFAADTDQINCRNNQLEAVLKEELNRKIEMTNEMDSTDKNINEMTNTLRELETEINLLDNRQKQMNVDVEEYCKTSVKKQQELQELETFVEDLTSQYSACMKIETENITLKAECDDLHEQNNHHKEKIAELSSNEEAYGKRIVELNQYIGDLETERSRMVDENLVIDEAIKTLQQEQEHNEKEHEELSLKIHQTSAELIEANSLLKSSHQDLSEQLLEASKTKNEFQNILKNLEKQLDEAKAISKESDLKLINFNEESEAINKCYEEKINTLNEDLQKSVEAYEIIVSDCEHNEEVNSEILQLTKDLENYRLNYAQAIQELQDSLANEIESKRKSMDELSAQCEQEYRNNEIKKTDALVELREIKARITDLHKQKVVVEKEIVTKGSMLKKCDNLIQRLAMKFNKVAQVAGTSSQSVVDTPSQCLSVATPKNKNNPMRLQSPGSESSGKTFDPDDVDLKRRFSKRPMARPVAKYTNPTKVPKRAPPPPKKMATQESDDWGFII